MTTPPSGASGSSSASGPGQTPPSSYGSNELPPIGPPLPPDDPWVKMMEKMFPSANTNDIQVYARVFRDNMFKMLQSSINHMTKQSHEAALRMKRAIEGND